MPAQRHTLDRLISRQRSRIASASLLAAASLLGWPAQAQRPASAPATPAARDLVTPAPLRDSLARTTEPIGRRVLLERLLARYPRDAMLHTELSASLLANPLIRVGWGGGN